MKPMTSVIVMVALPMLLAGAATAAGGGRPGAATAAGGGGGGGPGAFPLAKCFNETQLKAFNKTLCTDMGKTEAYCKDNKEKINKCKNQVMTGPNSQSIIQVSANCMESVAGVTIPADKKSSAEVYHKYIVQLVDSNPAICAKASDIVTCFKRDSNTTQLMQDCLAAAGR